MKPSKGVLIAGGVAVAGGAIWYIKKQEKQQSENTEPPIAAPVTYASSQEAAGNYGNFGGGGAPSSPGVPGVVTTPELEHNRPLPGERPGPKGCPPGTQAIGISAIAGGQGGVRCIPLPDNNPPQLTCPSGSHKICNMSALPGHSACHCEHN